MNQMVKYCVCCCLAMSAFLWCEAQNITRIEYYIDNDPGYGLATSVPFTAGVDISNISLNINPGTLSPGVHILCLRAKDANGKWSYNNKWAIAKNFAADAAGTAPKITQVEYYLDYTTDYGAGTPVTITSATNLANKTLSLPLASLPYGVHWIGFRAKDANGVWGYDNRWLFVKPFVTDTTTPTAAPKINLVEYYLDNDPGYGQATPVSITAATNLSDLIVNVNPATLSDGVHVLTTRARTVNGIWGYDNRWLL